VKPLIQGDELRVSSKSKDDLQAVMSMLRGADLEVAVQFTNYRRAATRAQWALKSHPGLVNARVPCPATPDLPECSPRRQSLTQLGVGVQHGPTHRGRQVSATQRRHGLVRRGGLDQIARVGQ